MEISNIYFLYEIGGKNNQEDYIWPPPGSATSADKVFIVSDGVGGSENGELASRLISESVGEALLLLPITSLSEKAVNGLLEDAQHKLVAYAKQHKLNADMATTFSLLVLGEEKAFITWCGDSRVYHIRKGKVMYKTADHSLVNTLVKKGEITEEEAAIHPQKNIILKAIRADYSPIEAETAWITDVQNGDYFLLCTDGLLENIGDNDLQLLADEHTNENNDIVNLFQQFCHNKTRDNYSMYLLQVNNEINITRRKNTNRFLFSSLLAFVVMGAIVGGYYYSKQDRSAREVRSIPKELDIPGTSVPAHIDTEKIQFELPEYKIIEEQTNTDTSKENIPALTIKKSANPAIHKKLLPTTVDGQNRKEVGDDEIRIPTIKKKKDSI